MMTTQSNMYEVISRIEGVLPPPKDLMVAIAVVCDHKQQSEGDNGGFPSWRASPKPLKESWLQQDGRSRA